MISIISLVFVEARAAGEVGRGSVARTTRNRGRLVAKIPHAWRGVEAGLRRVSRPVPSTGASHPGSALVSITDRKAFAELAIQLSGLDAARKSSWLSRDASQLRRAHGALRNLLGLRDEAKVVAGELRQAIMAAEEVQVRLDPTAPGGLRGQQLDIRLRNKEGTGRMLLLALTSDHQSGTGWAHHLWEPAAKPGQKPSFATQWMKTRDGTSFTVSRGGIERYEDRDSKVFRQEVGDAAKLPPIRGWVRTTDGAFRAEVKVDQGHLLRVMADSL